MSYQFGGKKQSKPFAFDGDYRDNQTSDLPREEKLVSFFDDEPAHTQSNNTDWAASRVSEEDLREGMDDYKKSEEGSEDLKDLIASMPHNIAKHSKKTSE